MIESISYQDPRARRVIKDGDVLWRTPHVEGALPLESWHICRRSVRCGRYAWPKGTVGGCGVEIGYLSAMPAPTECAICGSAELYSYNVYGVMGLGEKPAPDAQTYTFSPAVFSTQRQMVEIVVARRREIVTAHGADDVRVPRLTAIAAWLIDALRAAALTHRAPVKLP